MPSQPLPIASSQPINPIHLPRTLRLRPRPLAPDRHPHRVPPAPIRPHIPQPGNIHPELQPEFVLDLHLGQLGVDADDGLGA